MSAAADSPGAGRYIGRGLPRPGARRLLAGRGRYTDDVVLPRMLHAAFLRSPYAHARLGAIDVSAAAAMPGVHRVLTGADFEPLCTPWVGTLSHFKGMRSAPQRPLPTDKVVWAGQPVVMVVAETRAQAEDALEVIEVAFEELDAVVDLDAARAPESPVIDAGAPDNVLFRTRIEAGASVATPP
jgi:carbon-monoxide dehydrogenase large subunit